MVLQHQAGSSGLGAPLPLGSKGPSLGLAPEMGLLLGGQHENEAQPHPGQRLRSAGARASQT